MTRSLLLLCLAAASAAAYNLVVQDLILTGGKISSGAIKCDDINQLHIGKESVSFKEGNSDCFIVMNTADPPAIESMKLMYSSASITTTAARLNCEIDLKNSADKITFTISPQMKYGAMQEIKVQDVKFVAAATTAAPATTAAATASAPAATTEATTSVPLNAPNNTDIGKKPEVKVAVPAAAAAAAVPTLPPALRHRGPGPVRRPAAPPQRPESSDEEYDEEERHDRMRRDEPAVDDDTVHVTVRLYVLGEAGNAAAVWAAVIEGLILCALVGLCLYFFFIVPRRRVSGGPAAAPYKPEDRNYSVSYENSGYNQQPRIDAFQNPPAPPRPANSSYMDDYITDSVGAMSRPAPAASAAPIPAVNPAAFEPRHQRFDSSGLVTVNLS